MKSTLFILSLFLVGSRAMAEASANAIAPPSELSSGCDLDVPGIDKKLFLNFFQKLKAAAKEKDAQAMSKLVIYPMAWNTKPQKSIKNAETLRTHFSEIFSEKILRAISSQKLEKLFCRDQGVMVGDGEIWISQKGNKVGISAVNP